MRIAVSRFAAAALAATNLVALGACATSEGPSRYSQDYERLRADCEARDGTLMAIPRAATGQPETDNACVIRGGGGRLNE